MIIKREGLCCWRNVQSAGPAGEALGHRQERRGFWVSTFLQLPERRELRTDRSPTNRREAWLSPDCRSIPPVALVTGSSSGNGVIKGQAQCKWSHRYQEERGCPSRPSLGHAGRTGRADEETKVTT